VCEHEVVVALEPRRLEASLELGGNAIGAGGIRKGEKQPRSVAAASEGTLGVSPAEAQKSSARVTSMVPPSPRPSWLYNAETAP
jgi:hypothetical protein